MPPFVYAKIGANISWNGFYCSWFCDICMRKQEYSSVSRSEINVPISTELFLRLADHLDSRGSDRDPVDAVSAAVEFWIARSNAAAELQSGDNPIESPPPREQEQTPGYWWKGVEIPAGTKARMVYKGRIYSATIGPDGLQFEGASYSPSEFTWKITSTTRNAWRDIELQFAGSTEWQLAQVLRDKP